MSALLSVENLRAGFRGADERTPVLDGVSFELARGEALGLVGESGCGKSVTALAIMRLLPKPAGEITSGSVRLNGTDLLALPAPAMRGIRGQRIAMIFQEPMTALNPVHRIGRQIAEVFRIHRPQMDRRERRERAEALLAEVGIPSPRQRLDEYPHQLSGGMRQRVMIAMALALDPEVLIADEPTTALDVTIQAQILNLINRLRERHGTAVIFITHDLGVIAETCDRVAVMYAGRIAEAGAVTDVYSRPLHPYTHGLLNSVPRLDRRPRETLPTIAGTVPSIEAMPTACRFHTRCPWAQPVCREQRPSLREHDGNHAAACHFAGELEW